MKDATILKTGVIGALAAAIRCFTPVLVILLAGVGLSARLDWLDYVLFPALALFPAMIGYGSRRRQQCDGKGA